MTDSTSKRGWRRRLFRTSIWVMVIASGSIAASLYWIDPNRHAVRIESYLLRRTGLTVELGQIEWGLWPQLYASVDDARVSMNTWSAEIRGVSGSASVGSILRGRVNIGTIRAESIMLELPDQPRDWLQVYRDISDGIRGQGARSRSKISVESVGPIIADYVELRSNDFPDALLASNVTVSDVMRDSISISAAGSSPAGGSASRLEARATLNRIRGEGLKRVQCEGRIDSADLHGLIPEFPPALLSLRFNTISDELENLIIAIEGETIGAEHPALNGVLGATFGYKPGEVRLSDASYEAAEATIRANAVRDVSGAISVDLSEATVRGSALGAFLEQTHGGPAAVAATEDAHVTVLDAAFGMDPEGNEEFTRGTLEFAGISVLDQSGHAYETNLRGRGVMEGRQITIERIEGAHSTFSGYLEPDFENATLEYRGRGAFELTEQSLPPRVSEKYVPRASLPIVLDSLEGVFIRGSRPGRTLSFEATLSAGRVELKAGDIDTTISAEGGSLHFENGALEIGLRASSPEFGLVSASGRYDIEDRSVRGSVDCDARLVLPNFIPGLGGDSMYAPILDQFGSTRFVVETSIPRSTTETVTVSVNHETAPRLSGSIGFARGESGGLLLGDLYASGTLESETLDDRMKGPFVVSGPVDVIFERSSAKQTFEVDVDASRAVVRFGRRIEKRSGDPLTVEISGLAPQSRWSADRLTVTCFDETVPVRFVEGGLLCEPVRLNLGLLTRLAPEGGYLSGGASLGFSTPDQSFYFGFEDASFQLEDGLGLDALDGEVRVEGNRLGESELRLQNAAGDCTLVWTSTEGRWGGRVRGAYLDVDVLQRILEAIGRASGNSPAEPEVSAGGPKEFPLTGALEVELERVKYRNALFTGVSAAGTSTADAIRFSTIRGTAYGGSINGRATLLAGAPGKVSLVATFKEVDTALIDDLYFEGKQEIHGAATGRLEFNAPMGNIGSMLDAGNGSGRFTAVDGGFGKAGWATRFLSVLRTVEIFALRLPSLKDEGLVYDTCNAGFVMKDGRVTLDNTNLETPAYRMDATGYLDFGADATDIDVNVNLFQSFNRIASHIPLVRNVADLTTGRVAIRVDVTGPPESLEFSIPPDGGIIQNVIGIGGRTQSER